MAQNINIGGAKGRGLFGACTASQATVKTGPEGAKVKRRTLRLLGAFVEYAPGAKSPTVNDEGAVRVHGSTTLDAAEVDAMLASLGASSLDDEAVARLIVAINDAAASGEAFAVRLPATATSGTPKLAKATVLAAAAAFDPTL